MATTSTNAKALNAYQRLLKARVQFLNSDPKKSGKNMTLAFKYFELDDIVPIATKIFDEVGLLAVPNFTPDTAVLTIYNTDNPCDDFVVFTIPLVLSEGNKAVTPVQAVGASVTYYRRYLYMIALDICEPDSIDTMGNPNPAPITPVPAPATPVAKPTPAPVVNPIATPKEESKPLTNGNGNASETQIRQLKDLLIKLKEADPSKEEMIAQIAVQTKGFTVISKADCETLVIKIGEMLKKEDK